MSIFFRPARAGTDLVERAQALPLSFADYVKIWAGNVTDSGVTIPTTGPSAMQSVAVASAVDLLASLASELPVDVYSGTGSSRRQIDPPARLLDPAGDGYGLEDWNYQVMASWLLRGNMFGLILATGMGGVPTQVQLQDPDRVSGWIDDDGKIVWTVAGQTVPAGQMMHRRARQWPGRVLGLSPIEMHAVKMGLDLTTARFGLEWFGNGAHPGGILMNNEERMNREKVDNAKRAFMAALRNSREPLVLSRGWSWEQISISPEESQFLETQGFSAAECARIFGAGVAEVLGYESGGSLTYATLEGRTTHLLVFTLNRWLRRLERLMSSMLPRPQWARINRSALLQSTTLERYQVHDIALKDAIKTINEVRELEDMSPVPWGNLPLVLTQPAAGSAPADDEDGGGSDDQEADEDTA